MQILCDKIITAREIMTYGTVNQLHVSMSINQIYTLFNILDNTV